MALPEFSASPARDAPPQPVPAPLPGVALGRLPHLHDESRLALRRAGLLARAVPAAGWVVASHPEITPPSNFHHFRDTT